MLVEFRADDDFSFKTIEFRELAKAIAVHVAAANPAAVANGQEILSLLNQRYVKDESKSVRELIQACEEKLKVNLRVLRYCRYATTEGER